MRLLCLSQYPPDLGGIASHVRGLCRGLAGRGCQSLVLWPAAPGAPATDPFDDGPAVRVRPVPARYRSDEFEVAYALQNLQIIEAALSEAALSEAALAGRPDLVVCHGSQFALAALILAEATGAPLVYHAHNVYSAPQPPDTAFQPGLLLEIERDIAHRAAGVVAISGYVAELCTALGTDPARLTTIPKGLHMDEFAGEWRPPERPVARFVGRLSPEKGLDVLLAALAGLTASGRLVEALVAGSGEERYVATLRGLVAELGLTNRVFFAGQAGPDRLVQLYQRSSVTVVPSRMEALGRVALEAMASGCPVVVTDVGGLGGLVQEGCTGWKVPGGCAAELAEAIWSAVADPAEAGRRAGRAREVVSRDFTYEAVVDRTLEFYRATKA